MENIRKNLGPTGGDPYDKKVRERQELYERFAPLVQASERIEIKQTERDFEIIDADGDVRIYYIDGKKHERESPSGEMMETHTSWIDNLLAMKTEGKKLGTVHETYGLEGHQLVFIVRMEHQDLEEDIVIRSYYDRQKGESGL